MSNRNNRLFVFRFHLCLMFTAILLLSINTSEGSHGNDDHKNSPIFAYRLNITLEAWERQSKFINIFKQDYKLDGKLVKDLTLKDLAYDGQNKNKTIQETPLSRTQDTNDHRSISRIVTSESDDTSCFDPDDPDCSDITTDSGDSKCVSTIDPNDLRCKKTFDPRSPECNKTLDPHNEECFNATRDPEDLRCVTFDSGDPKCCMTSDPRDQQCGDVTRDPEDSMCLTFDPAKTECQVTYDPRCKRTLDPFMPECRETFDPANPNCCVTSDPHDPRCGGLTRDPANPKCGTFDPQLPDCQIKIFDFKIEDCQLKPTKHSSNLACTVTKDTSDITCSK